MHARKHCEVHDIAADYGYTVYIWDMCKYIVCWSHEPRACTIIIFIQALALFHRAQVLTQSHMPL